MAQNLGVWKSQFGEAYTDRNVIDWHVRLPAFRHMLDGLTLQRVLEVGCNRGHNLIAVSEILGDSGDVVGVEPNQHALKIARASSSTIGALYGHTYDLPFKDGYFDLVFTAGVLIHIALPDLPSALSEIYRVSRRYVMAVEYYAEQETVISYRGREDLLWKRDFLKHYQSQFADLVLVKSGYWGAEAGFDRANWWLLEKITLR